MTKVVSGVKKSSPWLKWNLLLLLLVGALYGVAQLRFWWQQLSPQWQGLELSWGQLKLQQLSLQLPLAGSQSVQLQKLELNWTGWFWPLDSVKASALTAQLDPQLWPESMHHSSVEATTGAELQHQTSVTEQSFALPLWFPAVLELRQIELSLPCARVNSQLSTPDNQSLCALTGAVSYDQAKQQLQLQLANQQAVSVADRGDLKLKLRAVMQTGQATLRLPELELELISQNFRWQQQQFSDLKLEFKGQLSWHQQQFSVQSSQPVLLQTAYQQPELQVQQLQLVAESLRLQLDPNQPQNTEFSADIRLTAAQLQHAQLYLMDWNWAGRLSYQQQKLQAEGLLSNNQSLRLQHKVQLAEQNLFVQWSLPELYLLAGNPLQLGPFWPQMLSLQQGKISATGQFEFNLDRQSLSSQRTELKLQQVGGIYDRTTVEGLTAQVRLENQGADWIIQSSDLSLAQLNHGLVMGPLQLDALYKTKAPNWQSGRLDLNQARLELFGGQISASAQQLDLAKDASLLLQLDKLQLMELLKQHPSTGITGQGTLSGTLPLSLHHGKVSIAQGKVAALEPGGRIAYQSEDAKALARSNQSMGIVVQALENFHFSLLAAEVSYSEQGQLLLALKLEGRNPDFEKGRAVNFVINLEEDIPAMITSLQLSGQVSDLVKQRVQQRLATQKAKDARKESQ